METPEVAAFGGNGDRLPGVTAMGTALVRLGTSDSDVPATNGDLVTSSVITSSMLRWISAAAASRSPNALHAVARIASASRDAQL